MQLKDFQNFAITTQEQSNVNGGNWREIRLNLMPHYGTAVNNYSAESQLQFNPFTGSVEESNYVNFSIEFEGGYGETFQIAKDDFDMCYDRLQRIFKF